MAKRLRSLLFSCGMAALAEATSGQIRAVQDPVYHYYLQAYPNDPSMAVLGPEASSEYFDIDGTIFSSNTSMYLNVGNSSDSYLPVGFGSTASTTAWALEGDTIITSTSSTWGRQLNFLVCQLASDTSYWQVYLQTGSSTPSSRTCSNYQTLHLPCLC